MSQPASVGATISKLDILERQRRFPFFWWAVAEGFKYPVAAGQLFTKCGSAAEAFFLRAFVTRSGVLVERDAAYHGTIAVVPQCEAAGYRIDFAVLDGATQLAVEIDGLAFHHAKAEQIERDYRRQRELTALGYRVIRFTAREAFYETEGCWQQVDEILGALSTSRISRRIPVAPNGGVGTEGANQHG